MKTGRYTNANIPETMTYAKKKKEKKKRKKKKKRDWMPKKVSRRLHAKHYLRRSRTNTARGGDGVERVQAIVSEQKTQTPR